MAITGLGASSLTISGGNLSRVFDITASTAQVTISDLTISGGYDSFGGGILNFGSLTVRDSTLSGNSASFSNGGGMYNFGNLTVDSTLAGNSATSGGAISNQSSLMVSGSTLSGNSAGAGILKFGAGSMTVSDSTLSDNSASFGGGIYNYGSLTVSDSTLSGNSASFGGGIFNNSSTNPVTLTNVTLADNRANNGGGGFYIALGAPVLHNPLIADNLVGSTRSDVSGALSTASDYNLIGDGSGMTGISDGDANHNQVGSATNPINPLLAPLGNYGGSTQTMALLPGSPAIDKGSSAYGGSTDQRGVARVGATDIGAFESQGFSIAVSSGNNQSANVNTAFAQPLVVSVTANNPIEPVQGGKITFTAPASGASALLSGSPALIGSDGKASITATANGTAGPYTVTAAIGIAPPASFSLTNLKTATTTSGVVSSLNPSIYGQPVTFSATVTASTPGAGVPTGTVIFRDGSTTLGTGILDASGKASFTTAPTQLGIGSHQITASYGGDDNGDPSVSPTALTQTVNANTQVPTVSGITPNSGSTAGGAVVTITGTGFTGATNVTFGGTNATTFTVNSATQITATAPAHAAGVVDVQVSNAGATSSTTNKDRFTYVASASPTSSVAVSGNTIASPMNQQTVTASAAAPLSTLPTVSDAFSTTSLASMLGKPAPATMPSNVVSASNDVSGTDAVVSRSDSVWLSGSPAFGTSTAAILLPAFDAINSSPSSDLPAADIADEWGGDVSSLALKRLDAVFASDFFFVGRSASAIGRGS